MSVNDITVTRAIVDGYNAKLCRCVESDVAVVGAGPSGLVCAKYLADAGVEAVVFEKKLSPGGGIWGGGMGMNEVVIQAEAKAITDDFGIRCREAGEGVFLVDAIELAASLLLAALRAGAVLLNLKTVEDVRVEDGRVTGVVVGDSAISAAGLHVDPLTFGSKLVVDATGHDAAVTRCVLKHGFKLSTPTGGIAGEGAMDAIAGERFVVEKVGEVFPNLLVTGMAVCAVCGGPRMGPIFGGMLLSGRKAAGIALEKLTKKPR